MATKEENQARIAAQQAARDVARGKVVPNVIETSTPVEEKPKRKSRRNRTTEEE